MIVTEEEGSDAINGKVYNGHYYSFIKHEICKFELVLDYTHKKAQLKGFLDDYKGSPFIGDLNKAGDKLHLDLIHGHSCLE